MQPVHEPPDVRADAHEVGVVAVLALARPAAPRATGVDHAVVVGVEGSVAHAEVVAKLVGEDVAPVAGGDHRPAGVAAADQPAAGPAARHRAGEDVHPVLIKAEVDASRSGRAVRLGTPGVAGAIVAGVVDLDAEDVDLAVAVRVAGPGDLPTVPLTVLQTPRLLRWMNTVRPSCSGATVPEKRTRRPRTTVLLFACKLTFIRTSTSTSTLVAESLRRPRPRLASPRTRTTMPVRSAGASPGSASSKRRPVALSRT